MPADIDEFRRDLARRIEEMAASWPDDDTRERPVTPVPDDPAEQ
jgi:hypothetical protein